MEKRTLEQRAQFVTEITFQKGWSFVELRSRAFSEISAAALEAENTGKMEERKRCEAIAIHIHNAMVKNKVGDPMVADMIRDAIIKGETVEKMRERQAR